MDVSSLGGTETVAIRDGHPVLLRTTLELTIDKGPDVGRRMRVKGHSLLLGSSSSLDEPLADETVSRRHAVIERRADGSFLVRDLGSRNGTRVDGVSVFEAPIAPEQRLALGRVELSLRLADEPDVVALSERESFGALVGRSAPMRVMYAALERLAETDLPVLLQGETGTGKELCARAIHDASRRRDGPFVVLDCAAVSASLIDAELFGHVRGAFTGADRDRAGVFERAHGGTLFIDELGELSKALQPKLLRVLESGEVRPIGAEATLSVNVRVVAATHRDLDRMVGEGTFREDLLHRLSVAEVRLPPLRERIEDVPLVAAAIAGRMLGKTPESPEKLFGDEALRAMRRHPWPGNVRELRNWVARAVQLGGETGVDPLSARRAGAMPPVIDVGEPYSEARAAWVEWFERQYVTRILAEHDDNLAEAARSAGVDRTHLHRLARKLGLRAVAVANGGAAEPGGDTDDDDA